VADGPSALVKSLLQALIHEIRVDSREAIHPVFPVPLGAVHRQDDAVRAPPLVELMLMCPNPSPELERVLDLV